MYVLYENGERIILIKTLQDQKAPKYDSAWFVCISETGSLWMHETVQGCLTNVHFFIYRIEWTFGSKLDG